MSFTPATYNIVIYQGSDFSEDLTWKDSTGTPINLTGATWEAQIRTDFAAISGAALMVTTVDATGGTFRIAMPKTTTAALPNSGQASQREYVYGVWDCEVTLGGLTNRILEGSVTVSKEASK